jgi:hypothetical protein
MKSPAPDSIRARKGPPVLLFLGVLAVLFLPACASGPPELPDPRPIVIRSGARVFPEKDRMQEIDAWMRPQMDNIEFDPSFLIEVVPQDSAAYPWESLIIYADTAKIGLERTAPTTAGTAYMLYAHYHLMDKMGRLDEFLPGGAGLSGLSLERAILARVADAWLLGRGVYDVEAYEPMEEILYSHENGYLDALILTARGDEFQDERQAWLREDPEAQERYKDWFLETFDTEPPGLRGKG